MPTQPMAARLMPDRQNDSRDAFLRAITLANQAARVNPNDWEVRGVLALYHAYTGNFPAAHESLDMVFQLNLAENPITHLWAARVAYEEQDIEKVFEELDMALTRGFSEQKHFIADEPAFAQLRRTHAERFQALMDRH